MGVINIKVEGVQGPARMYKEGVTEVVQDLLRKLLTEKGCRAVKEKRGRAGAMCKEEKRALNKGAQGR
jgi:hypothetical protein